MDRKGSAAIVVVAIIVLFALVGGVWYYEAHRSSLSAPLQNSMQATSTENSVGTISQTSRTVGTTTIVTVTDPAVAAIDWFPGQNDATSTFALNGSVYAMKDIPAPCPSHYYSFDTDCDKALTVTANGTTTVLMPSLWNAITPEFKSRPGYISFIGGTNKQIFLAAAFYANEAQQPIGLYSLDLASGKLSGMAYTPGNCQTLVGSVPYVADYYNASTTPTSEDVKVFSLIDNAYVYDQNIPSPKVVEDGGMGCQAFVGSTNGAMVQYYISNNPNEFASSSVQVVLSGAKNTVTLLPVQIDEPATGTQWGVGTTVNIQWKATVPVSGDQGSFWVEISGPEGTYPLEATGTAQHFLVSHGDVYSAFKTSYAIPSDAPFGTYEVLIEQTVGNADTVSYRYINIGSSTINPPDNSKG